MEKNRHITPGAAIIPKHLISLIWECYDSIEWAEKDSLQIFELYVNEYGQAVDHYQQQPEHHAPTVYCARIGPCWSGRVFVIDNDVTQIMCLPEER